MVDAKVIKVVREYIQELMLKGILIKKAFIYGSHVHGKPNQESDIDLMLISPLFDNDTDKYMPSLWLSRIRTDNRIEPVAVGEKRFLEDDTSPLIEIVRREGFEVAT
ncbi:MAG TPA: nucleotidyltransferase domain-containing protein [Ignavibacteria bacterium]|nr:nucleotidyltransferase domain-containing protein [Ignavibacteria bacterium]